MDYDALRFWLDVVVLLAVLANTIYVWVSTKHKVNREAIESVNSDVGLLINRVSVLEDRVKTAPTHNDLGMLYERMNTLGNQINKANGTLEAMATQLSLINEHLINGGKR